MQENITHQQVLAGPGLTYKTGGDYEPGEYQTLTNIDITEEGLRNRPPAQWSNQSHTPEPFSNFLIGSVIDPTFSTRRIIASSYGLSGGTYKTLITRIDDPADVTPNNVPDQWNNSGAEWFLPQVCFEYNNVYYLMGQQFATGLVAPPNISNIRQKSSPTQIDSATVPTTTGVTSLPGSGRLVAAAILKDRVFLARNNTIIWSKATDPTNFTVPDGGFFKIPDTKINHIIALRDVLYIFASTGIWQFSYSGDPGVTGVLKQIIDNLHFTHGQVIEGTPVGVDINGDVYAIQNGFAQLIVSLNRISSNSPFLPNNRIEPFRDGFIVNRSYRDRFDLSTVPFTYMYYYNLKTQSLSYYQFKDGSGTTANVIDILSVYSNKKRILVMVFHNYTNTRFEIAYLDPTDDGTVAWGLDTLPGGATEGMFFIARIINIVPDGFKDKWKRFRHVVMEGLMGDTPTNGGTTVNWGFARQLTNAHTANIASESTGADYPYVYRVGIMQKAKILNLEFKSATHVAAKANDFRLSALKVIWDYTSKVIGKSKGSAE